MAIKLSTPETRIIRSEAAGPEPCNTLVFLRCLVPGLDVPTRGDGAVRNKLRFTTEFRLDNYLQSKYDWYKENTHVSAVVGLKFLNTTTDLTFLMAVDSVEPKLEQLDGTLGFEVGTAAAYEDDAWFGGGAEVLLTASLTAYVLCFEPREERPPSGAQRTPWARDLDDEFKPKIILPKRSTKSASTKNLRKAANCDP